MLHCSPVRNAEPNCLELTIQETVASMLHSTPVCGQCGFSSLGCHGLVPSESPATGLS